MKDVSIIDNFLDNREFRNYIVSLLPKMGFENITIDDVRISDGNIVNDNDIKACKDNIKYTIQTFLNQNITNKEIEETILDMFKERVTKALLITNMNVDKDVLAIACQNNIEVIDRDILCDII